KNKYFDRKILKCVKSHDLKETAFHGNTSLRGYSLKKANQRVSISVHCVYEADMEVNASEKVRNREVERIKGSRYERKRKGSFFPFSYLPYKVGFMKRDER
ncbi:hypothetical protein, partial [Acidianus sp. RZ1]|uniref:hypothetical protein n=1 Tax=Acidianus sp. RZ1 TaxID=1540082 RepID=UPI001C10FC61